MNRDRHRLTQAAIAQHKAEDKVTEARERRDRAIKSAYLTGIGASEIAELTGLSRPYIHALVKGIKA